MIDTEIKQKESIKELNNRSCCLNDNSLRLDNSIIPSIEESERFIKFLEIKFNLELPKDLIVNIQETSPNTKGFFMPKEHLKSFENTTKKLNFICLSSLYLKENEKNNPYEIITHELAHYINYIKGIKDASSSQYHNKHFKSQAEKLLLRVEKDSKRGFSATYPTEEFLKMLEEFKPNSQAFHIQQRTQEGNKAKVRNLLYMCSCGCKIRSARNKDKPLKAVCEYCNSPFITKSDIEQND